MHRFELLGRCEFTRWLLGSRSKHLLGWPATIDAIIRVGESVAVAIKRLN